MSAANGAPAAFPRPAPARADLPWDLPALIDAILQAAPVRPAPFVIHMLGMPGAGKSTMAARLADRLERCAGRRPAIVAFDALMETIPAYRALPDRSAAFARFEGPARDAGYALMRDLLEKGADLLIDHGGAAPEHPAILAFAAGRGYAVYVVEVVAGLEKAKERVARREASQGRHTPPAYLDERARVIEGVRADYRRIARRFFRLANETDGPSAGLRSDALADEIAADLERLSGP